jgi:hypothetical protein
MAKMPLAKYDDVVKTIPPPIISRFRPGAFDRYIAALDVAGLVQCMALPLAR